MTNVRGGGGGAESCWKGGGGQKHVGDRGSASGSLKKRAAQRRGAVAGEGGGGVSDRCWGGGGGG